MTKLLNSCAVTAGLARRFAIVRTSLADKQMGYSIDDFQGKPVIGIINTGAIWQRVTVIFGSRRRSKRGVWQEEDSSRVACNVHN